ncbi:MAG: HupE/UreJ family protein [Verrucomicrobiota bacterium]
MNARPLWRAALGGLTLAASALCAHPQWKEANCIAVAEDSGSLSLTIKFDVPSYLTGKLPKDAPIEELDALMRAPDALEKAMDGAHAKFMRTLKVTADGTPVRLDLRQFPEAGAVRTQSARQGEADRYPVLMNARVGAELPAGTRRVEIAFPPELGTVFTNFRKGMEYQVVTAVIPGEAAAFDVDLPMTGLAVFLLSGFEHVIPAGWDHCLFMLAMFLCAGTVRLALLRSLIFTAGHAVTLTLVVTGALPPTGPWIEPVIAFTIAWAGYEAWRGAILPVRWLVPLTFGLVHGLGFAAAAADRLEGWDRAGIVELLVGFNVGIESAQVGIVLVSAGIFGLLNRAWPSLPARKVAAIAVGGVGVYVCLERTLGLLSL